MGSAKNPYVGPRTFTRQQGDCFFGREREARELLSLVIAERLVLFYAPSGAGKSSLINTRLIPQLEQAGYAVLPVGRVSGELPAEVDPVDNIFTFNLLLSLEDSNDTPGRFARMSLTDFLARLTSPNGKNYYFSDEEQVRKTAADPDYQETPYVLIIDQFEEILTTHPERWREQQDFFEQLNQAMQADPLLWVVLALREDYAAALDAYAHLVPGGMRARFHMQRLSYQAALEAVKRPAEYNGRPFASGVAETLVNNLRQIRRHSQTDPQFGQFIEPVQLQVVCYQLWQTLAKRPPGPITETDLSFNDIEQALIQFYETALRQVARATGESEQQLRHWFQQQLITEAGTRGTVYRGQDKTGGLSNQAADLLVDQFLLRAEIRAGGTWYELTHDRFIPPIQKSNAQWQISQLKRRSGLSLGLVIFLMSMMIVGLVSKLFWEQHKLKL